MLNPKTNKARSVIRILVIGVGGAGNNVINYMMNENIMGVKVIGIDTDKQALQLCRASKLLQIGEKLTKGQGACAKPELGEKAAEESREKIAAVVKSADMVFVICGMGGGTGTGAAPVVACIARNMGIPTVCVVSTPFRFEAKARMANAISGLERMKDNADTLIVIPNDKLLEITDICTTIPDVFKRAAEVFYQVVRGITSPINVPAAINLDFTDVQTVMKGKGTACIGIGSSRGGSNVREVVKMAVESPFLGNVLSEATYIIINMSGDITTEDAFDAADYVQKLAGGGAKVILGAMYDLAQRDSCQVSIIAKKNEISA